MIRWILVDLNGITWYSGLTKATEPLRVEQGRTSAIVFAGETRQAILHNFDGLPALRLISWPL